jgi:ATP-dependent DNA helicase PIF1
MNIVQKISLSLEQQKVLTLVVQEGKNIFFTGSAGDFSSLQLPASSLLEWKEHS